VQASNYASANAMALLLLVFCFAVLTVVYGLNRRTLHSGTSNQKSWTIGPVK
jgi:ABC-type Fe3+ transport system permease subunit